jgi:hypothetical protein
LDGSQRDIESTAGNVRIFTNRVHGIASLYEIVQRVDRSLTLFLQNQIDCGNKQRAAIFTRFSLSALSVATCSLSAAIALLLSAITASS